MVAAAPSTAEAANLEDLELQEQLRRRVANAIALAILLHFVLPREQLLG